MRTTLLLGLIAVCGVFGQEQSGSTFKSGVTMIQVPVVVRDHDGHAVGDLTKDDFQLFDDGKPVAIGGFTVEKPGGHAIADRSLPDPDGAKPANSGAAADVPERFITYFFDDISLGGFTILQHIRDAAAKQLNALQPGDRVAIVASSCTIAQDFTNDRARLQEALSHLQISPPRECGVAGTQITQIEVLKNVVKRMANLPGRKEILLISAGFSLAPASRQWVGQDRSNEQTDLIEAAVRSKVIINSLDTGGATEFAGKGATGGDTMRSRSGGNAVAPSVPYARDETLPLVLVDLSRGTGGTYVTGNDYNVNFRKLSTPESYYILSFAPTAKTDGKLHQLRVKLEKKGKFTITARTGYYAPEHAE